MKSEKTVYSIELLAKHHDRSLFSCGIEALDRYLTEQASQEIRKHIATTFVLLAKGCPTIIGYYSLSSVAIDAGELPESIRKKLPKYALLPATLLGRLAIAKNHQKKGLGGLLIIDALQRSIRVGSEIASMAIIVDAKDENVISFYERYGFIQFPKYKYKLFLPIATAIKLLT